MRKNRIIVIGASRFGANIAKELSENGENVTIIDKNVSSFNKLSDSFSGFIIKGDATDLTILENNGIYDAKKIIVTTNNDNINIFLSHVCFHVYDVPDIYIRLSDNDKSKLIENTPIKAIYPFVLSKRYFNHLINNNIEGDINENSNS